MSGNSRMRTGAYSNARNERMPPVVTIRVSGLELGDVDPGCRWPLRLRYPLENSQPSSMQDPEDLETANSSTSDVLSMDQPLPLEEAIHYTTLLAEALRQRHQGGAVCAC